MGGIYALFSSRLHQKGLVSGDKMNYGKRFALMVSVSVLTTVSFAGASMVSLGGILKQDALNGYYDSGTEYLVAGSGVLQFDFAIMMEDAGFANTNSFGVFDAGDPSRRIEIFAGNKKAGAGESLFIDSDAGKAWLKPNKKYDFSGTFGFYIDSSKKAPRGGVYYSDAAVNSGPDADVQHVLVFDVRDEHPLGGGVDIVLGMEDLSVSDGGYDGDFNDMVVSVNVPSGVNPVPEPATLAIFGIGMLVTGVKKK